MSQVAICFGIFLLMILGYIFYDKLKLPMGATALAALLLLVLTGCLDAKTALGGFGKANTVLIISMFVVAAGFNRTQAVKKMTHLLYRVGGGSFRKMLAGFILITCLLSQFIPSPMAVFGIVYPMVLAMCSELNISPSKAIFPVGFVSVSTCAVLPVGSGATTYATMNGYLASFEVVEQFQILDFFKARIPVLVAILLYAILVAPKFAPDTPPVPLAEVRGKGGKEKEPLSPVREWIGLGTFVLVTGGLIFQSLLPVESWQITLAGAVIMVASGVLTPREAQDALPLRVVCMYIGALAMGAALTATGAGDLIGSWISALVGGVHNGYVIGLIFFLAPFILTQVMQNQSVSNIFIPIVIIGCKALGVSPLGPLVLVQAASLTAYMTPMATGTVPMMMGAGGYDIKSLMKQGWLPAIIIAVVSVAWTMTIFPAFPG